MDATTPVVEIEEPLLSAADLVDGLLKETRMILDFEGVNILLFSSCGGDVEEVTKITLSVVNKLLANFHYIV